MYVCVCEERKKEIKSEQCLESKGNDAKLEMILVIHNVKMVYIAWDP